MPETDSQTFYFRAAISDGGMLAGELSALSDHDALKQLKAAGYVPLQLASRPIRQPLLQREIVIGDSRRLSASECESFCRELAILLSSGVELTNALGTMESSLPQRSRTQRFTRELRNWLRMGTSLAQAIRKTRFMTPPDLIPAIEAGERSAQLSTALVTLADRLGDASRLSRTVTGALAYPLFLLIVALAVIGILAFFVAPNLVGLFTSMDRPVPTVIGLLDGMQLGLRANPLTTFAIASGVAVTCLALMRMSAVRLLLHRIAFSVPLLGTALSWAAAGRFAGTLKLFVSSNIPLATAVPSAYAAAGLPVDTAAISDIAEQIRRGERLSSIIERAGLFPSKVVHLIRVGEANARLPEVLGGIVEDARHRFEQRLTLLTALLAPLLIVLVGSLVGWIIFTVFSALLSINDLAS